MILDFFAKAWNWILKFFDSLGNIASWLLDGIIYIFLSIPYLLFKIFLSIIHGIVSVLNVGSFAVDLASGWGLLPSQLAFLIGQIGLDVGLSMLAFAYGIRFLLNLIPASVTRI